MKLEAGMYARTKELNDVIIVKVLEVIDDGFKADNNMFYMFSEVIKASHNIIDLIKVGDYVNGGKVSRIENDYIVINEIWTGRELLNNKDIKTILTKEQIKHYTYEIGDE